MKNLPYPLNEWYWDYRNTKFYPEAGTEATFNLEDGALKEDGSVDYATFKITGPFRSAPHVEYILYKWNVGETTSNITVQMSGPLTEEERINELERAKDISIYFFEELQSIRREKQYWLKHYNDDNRSDNLCH